MNRFKFSSLLPNWWHILIEYRDTRTTRSRVPYNIYLWASKPFSKCSKRSGSCTIDEGEAGEWFFLLNTLFHFYIKKKKMYYKIDRTSTSVLGKIVWHNFFVFTKVVDSVVRILTRTNRCPSESLRLPGHWVMGFRVPSNSVGPQKSPNLKPWTSVSSLSLRKLELLLIKDCPCSSTYSGHWDRGWNRVWPTLWDFDSEWGDPESTWTVETVRHLNSNQVSR